MILFSCRNTTYITQVLNSTSTQKSTNGKLWAFNEGQTTKTYNKNVMKLEMKKNANFILSLLTNDKNETNQRS